MIWMIKVSKNGVEQSRKPRLRQNGSNQQTIEVAKGERVMGIGLEISTSFFPALNSGSFGNGLQFA